MEDMTKQQLNHRIAGRKEIKNRARGILELCFCMLSIISEWSALVRRGLN